MALAVELLRGVDVLIVLGIASAILSTLAFIPYMRDTIGGTTQPQRASWLIWAVLGSIAFCSQVYEGATISLWFAGVQVASTMIILVLSVRCGSGRFLGRSDYYILAMAAAGLVLWYFTDSAVYALGISIGISLLGGVATVVKAYQDPDSETLSTWLIALAASCCAVFSVGKLDWILMAYPLYLFTLYGSFVAAIVLGRLRTTAGGVVASGVALAPQADTRVESQPAM